MKSMVPLEFHCAKLIQYHRNNTETKSVLILPKEAHAYILDFPYLINTCNQIANH